MAPRRSARPRRGSSSTSGSSSERSPSEPPGARKFSTHEENRFRLPAGAQVGGWRIEAWQGQGTYGAVYRAVRAGDEHSTPVALKLALFPSDARPHRKEAFLACEHAIEQLKQDVPIWKKEFFEDGEVWVGLGP